MITVNPAHATTGIGSLPHHNIDSALDFSFRAGIPFLPQIPIRNPWEFMIAQALEGLPGLEVEKDGAVFLNLDVWKSRSQELDRKLNEAFSRSAQEKEAFIGFEPSPAVSSSWQPFLWELEERGTSLAKIQIAGPMTAQWALRAKGGDSLDQYPEVTSQIFRLIMARAVAMSRRLKTAGIQPLIFLDEPGLYGLSLTNTRHLMGLQELKLLVQTLSKEGATIGLHCCSNTIWSRVLELGLDYLSIDADLSLSGLIGDARGARVAEFVKRGGRLSLGIIRTGSADRSVMLRTLRPAVLFGNLMETLGRVWKDEAELVKKVLGEALYTPACGLALHSTEEAEWILETLNAFHKDCISKL
ncbi:MAG TPA: hypothetical protein VJB59_14060 [Bdellovibrionota bacterium]|nr:hypothetical protein [Bdellovibrionota bacterium]